MTRISFVAKARRRRDASVKLLRRFYAWFDQHSAGSLSILRYTLQRFGELRASDGAASVAFWAFFSLFPLLLFLVALGSFFLASDQVYAQVLSFVGQIFPGSQELIQQNIQQVMAVGGPAGLIGFVGLLISATGSFEVLSRHINLAWSTAKPRSIWQYRLLGLGMIVALIGLLILSVLSTAAANVLTGWQIPLGGNLSIYGTAMWKILSGLVPAIFTFLMFVSLYRWVPRTQVKWSQAMWGAAIATAAWQLVASAFVWFLHSELTQYQLIYGSLGTVVGLMIWIYLCSLIALFGAHLSAAVAHQTDPAESARRQASLKLADEAAHKAQSKSDPAIATG
jgi:membrane protein